MTVDVFFSIKEVEPSALAGGVVVVIDVLRATTTIATALTNGCKEIIPAGDVQTAFALAAKFPPTQVLIGGEREGRKVAGFHLGNSPLEYTKEAVWGKTLILTTTNGTRALMLSREADLVVALSLVNMSAVCQYVAGLNADVSILSSGTNGENSLEDTVCAGLLVGCLQKIFKQDVRLAQNAHSAKELAEKHQSNLFTMLKTSKHGAFLCSIGFAADLDFCARLDSMTVVPVYRDGSIRSFHQKNPT